MLSRHKVFICLNLLLCFFPSASIVKEREDESRSRGFGFVTFYEARHVEDAVKDLNDSVLS